MKQKNMNILLFTHLYLPKYSGGTEISTHAIARELHNLGQQVEVICGDDFEKGNSHWNGELDDIHEGIPIKRLKLNWKLAPDPCRYLYENPKVAEFIKNYLPQVHPDIVHVTSCVTLSASVITTVASLGYPIVLTLTDFWFLCPRITLTKPNGEQCDGHTTSWDCLKCMLWDSKVYRWPIKLLPERIVSSIVKALTKIPYVTRYRGLRGKAFNIDHRKFFLSNALLKCDRIIVKSSYVKEVFLKHGVPLEKLAVLPDGEDTNWGLHLLRKSSNIVRIGYVGQIFPQKGVHVLIQAFLKAAYRGSAELHIYGSLNQEPHYTKLLMEMANRNEQIYFHGGFNRSQIADVYSNIDVLVVPSIWPETFSHVIREAFIAKIPVIGSDIGAIPEAIDHNINGYLFSPGNVQELSNYLEKIIDTPNIIDNLRKNIPKVRTTAQQVAELIKFYEMVQIEHNERET